MKLFSVLFIFLVSVLVLESTSKKRECKGEADDYCKSCECYAVCVHGICLLFVFLVGMLVRESTSKKRECEGNAEDFFFHHLTKPRVVIAPQSREDVFLLISLAEQPDIEQ
ncbi:hypothetical protein GE061_005209 [Apolygus lucorum]|uniref:Uncharacterized protein n=1 Tax=Apolygus lucorum TaxID=248454 RepID=A0A8S9WX03_APOLU|nr:hypothetical protein GE061_005209 [Apolygus lucorum]